MALYLDLLQGEWINIENGLCTIQVVRKTGRKVRLRIGTNQERQLEIHRSEREDAMSNNSRDRPD